MRTKSRTITVDGLLRKEGSEAQREAMLGKHETVTGHLHLQFLMGMERVFYIGRYERKFTPHASETSERDSVYCKFTEKGFDSFSSMADREGLMEGSKVEVTGQIRDFPGSGFYISVDEVKPVK